jgi:hypothetical protein
MKWGDERGLNYYRAKRAARERRERIERALAWGIIIAMLTISAVGVIFWNG